jgi:hypothetical protein
MAIRVVSPSQMHPNLRVRLFIDVVVQSNNTCVRARRINLFFNHVSPWPIRRHGCTIWQRADANHFTQEYSKTKYRLHSELVSACPRCPTASAHHFFVSGWGSAPWSDRLRTTHNCPRVFCYASSSSSSCIHRTHCYDIHSPIRSPTHLGH